MQRRRVGSAHHSLEPMRCKRWAEPTVRWLTVSLLVLCGRPARAAEVQRIISLAPSVTETIFALGLGDRLVGVSVYCDYPPEAERIDRVGTFLTPNVEAIVAKRPDIIIAVPTPGNQGSVQALRRLGLKVVLVDPNTVAEIRVSLLTIGRELGHEEAARALVGRIDTRIAAVQARLDDAPVRRVLMVVGQTPLVAVGTGTFQDELIRMAHGDNLAARAGGSWPRLSIEFAIAAAPEVIIDTSMGNEEQVGAAPAMDFWKSFPTIPAVRDGHVYGYKAYQVLRPGPRIAEAFAAVAHFIHPERFAVGGDNG
jgi:iron complex transport system substrate-binding protein